MSAEWSKIWRDSQLELELLQAAYTSHAFPPHLHDYYVICLIDKGFQSFSYRGTKYNTPPGGLIILNPGEIHTGEPADEQGFEYRALYPTLNHMQEALFQLTDHPGSLPYFAEARIDQPKLSRWVSDLHLSLINSASPIERESRFLWVLTFLIKHYSDTHLSERSIGRERRAVQQVRNYIETHYDQGVSLTELAKQVHLSPYYLLRVFRNEVGIPPHAYLESVRIRRAQRLLAQGLSIAQVAQDTGFNHQSHFTHRFKRLIGVTPGQYAQQFKTQLRDKEE